VDDDCSHEIKRRLLLGRKVMTNLNSVLNKKQRHYFADKELYSQSTQTGQHIVLDDIITSLDQ